MEKDIVKTISILRAIGINGLIRTFAQGRNEDTGKSRARGRIEIWMLTGLAILLSVGVTALKTLSVNAAEIGDVKMREKDGMLMLYVPAGDFTMGCEDGEDDEMPMRRIFLDAYWIDQHEITNVQYAKCVAAGACAEPHISGSWTRDSYYGNGKYADYPVITVDWSQANAYCKWAGGYLPTEAQWEKAARGTDGRMFPWGNTFDGTRLNYCDMNCDKNWKDGITDDGYADTAPVCSYPAGNSPYGACDMAGNVVEWVNDWYDEAYYGYSPKANPQGPDSGEYRILRGGSWIDGYLFTRAANRDMYYPSDGDISWGFRCAFSKH